MTLRIQPWILLVTSLTATVLFTQSSNAAGTHRPDALIQLSGTGVASTEGGGGRWVGNDIYNTTGAHQKRFAKNVGSIVIGEYADFTLEIQNDGSRKDAFVVRSPGKATVDGWRFTFQSPQPGCGDCRPTDVTGAIRGAGYKTGVLYPGGRAFIMIRMQYNESFAQTAAGTYAGKVARKITVASVADGTRRDAVVFGMKFYACTC